MQYPLNLSFKLFSLASEIFVKDAAGQQICYVQQKMFKFKEHVVVYRDSSKTSVLCEIKADRIIDWSASYHFFDPTQAAFGAVKRKGMRSIWRAHYDVLDEHDQPLGTIREENPMAKVFDSMLSEIPLLGFATGYLFHPKYMVAAADGTPRMRLTKVPEFLSRSFRIDKLSEMDSVDELTYLMSVLMMTLLERARG